LPREMLLKENRNRLRDATQNEPYMKFTGDFVPTDNCLFIRYSRASYVYYLFYFVEPQKLFYGLTSDDVYLSFSLSNVQTSINGNTLVAVTNAYEFDLIKRADVEWRAEKLSSEFIEFLDSVNLEDNPFVVFYHLKEFNK
jgi:hypothetical protein